MIVHQNMASSNTSHHDSNDESSSKTIATPTIQPVPKKEQTPPSTNSRPLVPLTEDTTITPQLITRMAVGRMWPLLKI